MAVPGLLHYLADIVGVLKSPWPENRTVNLVCHGHSVPAGYFATPVVDSLYAYPHLLYTELKNRYPFAVLNVIVTAVGGESSDSGAERFGREVMTHRPDVVTIDYGLNDRRIGLEAAERAWRSMIEAALEAETRVILLTPTADMTMVPGYAGADAGLLSEHAGQIRSLASEYGVGLADSFSAFEQYSRNADLMDLLSWPNHPNRLGHELVVRGVLRWFAIAAGTMLEGESP